MTLEEILAELDEPKRAAVQTAIQNEKTAGINASNKKDKENLKLKSSLKELGYDSEKFETVDLFIADRKAIADKAATGEVTIATLNSDVSGLQTRLDDMVAKEKKATTDARNSSLTAKLTSSIGNTFYGSDYMIKDLIRESKVDLVGGEVVFKKGDEVIAFDAGVAQLKEANKDSLKVVQKGGSGDKGGDSFEGGEPSTFAEKLKAAKEAE